MKKSNDNSLLNFLKQMLVSEEKVNGKTVYYEGNRMYFDYDEMLEDGIRIFQEAVDKNNQKNNNPTDKDHSQ
tara:strand:- start:16449 stop:16664 length:216 start_codon:yes stop_codon:yes gene_type:complete